MRPLTETAYAKLNLALHVRGRRDDGYHEIETIFAFVDQGDILTIAASDKLNLAISGPFRNDLDAGEGNLVLKTARFLQNAWRVANGAALSLDKRLPIASGIGGGSADAAATARLLNRFWGQGHSDAELADMIAHLGADIPACIFSKTCIGGGTGTDLIAADGKELANLPLLLVNPRKPVSTGEIFHRWDGTDRGALAGGAPLQLALASRNDLQPMATELCPDIAEILAVLDGTSPLLSRMSGSGATCFAIFPTEAARDEAEVAIASHNGGLVDDVGKAAMSPAYRLLGTPKARGLLIVGDHASNAVPDEIDLGIDAVLLKEHIAWDIGVADVATRVVETIDCAAILGGQSRLVADLNRYPDEVATIPHQSDGIAILGNMLSGDERMTRLSAYYHPYHDKLSAILADTRPALILSLHSFTPGLKSRPEELRPWEVGVLYNEYETASKLAIPLLEQAGLIVGDQQPYSGKLLNATMNRHAEANDIPYVGIEMRQDMVSDADGQARFAQILSDMCNEVTKRLGAKA